MPPSPVVVRWNTWFYIEKHFHYLKYFVESELCEETKTQALSRLNDLFKDNSLLSQVKLPDIFEFKFYFIKILFFLLNLLSLSLLVITVKV